MRATSRRFLAKILPFSAYARLRRWRDALVRSLAGAFSSSEGLASIYYLFDRSFGREHRAVLAGKHRYFADRAVAQDSDFLLRRNVHRLEKGLISRPRRAVFASKYIGETVDLFVAVLERADGHVDASGELRWAHDVLASYFEAAGSESEVDRARARFADAVANAAVEPRETPLAPRARGPAVEPPVTPEAFRELTLRRRSVRWFEKRPVPRDAIDEALHAAGQAPSACNRLPFTFYVFDDPDAVQRVASLPAGTSGFEHNFPVVVVVVGQLRAYFSERDRHLIYIDASLAAMSFMLALETHGLSSCPINWSDLPGRERRMREMLGLQADERPIMLMAVGYPDPTGGVPASEKRGLDELRTYNPTLRTPTQR